MGGEAPTWNKLHKLQNPEHELGWGYSSAAEPLLGMCEVLSSTPRTEENIWNYRIFEKFEN